MATRFERDDRVSKVVGFLQPSLSLARNRQTPNVIRARGQRFKLGAVCGESRQFALAEGNLCGSVGKQFTFRPANG